MRSGASPGFRRLNSIHDMRGNNYDSSNVTAPDVNSYSGSNVTDPNGNLIIYGGLYSVGRTLPFIPLFADDA